MPDISSKAFKSGLKRFFAKHGLLKPTPAKYCKNGGRRLGGHMTFVYGQESGEFIRSIPHYYSCSCCMGYPPNTPRTKFCGSCGRECRTIVRREYNEWSGAVVRTYGDFDVCRCVPDPRAGSRDYGC